jgi:hypothetical protein
MDHGQFTSAWNPTVLYVEPYFGGEKLSNASSFLWAHDSRIFLVTNWHVLSGRNALTGAVMHATGAIPSELKVHSYLRVGTPTPPEKGFRVTYTSIVVQLVDSATQLPKWVEHPAYGRRVDVAALDVTEAVVGLHYACVNLLEGDIPKHIDPGDDVFIIGFPFGLITGAQAPIWKRGSIALDPGLNPEGLPKMLVDTATRPGMSGSVVIAMFPTPEHDVRRGDDPRPIYLKEYPSIIGVYSGRHYPDLEQAQLGIVWKRAMIEAVVSSGAKPKL